MVDKLGVLKAKKAQADQRRAQFLTAWRALQKAEAEYREALTAAESD